jgi:hypothetical protein
MKMPNLFVNAVATWDGKALTKGQKQIQGLEKGVKNLGKAFGISLGATALLAFSKASLQAAAADEKAQKQLALALKNVGLGRDAASAEKYIQQTEKEFAIIDDKLRPAYSRLAIATKNTVETQRLMGIAMDISASTGKDLDSVTGALAKAYLGNNTALGKLGIGISKADLKTKSFKDITDQLATTFAGAAKTSADSFAGSMEKLAIASNNAKETIGVGMIDALNLLGGDKNIDGFVSGLEQASLYIADIIRGIGVLGEKLRGIPVLGTAFSLPLDAYVQAIPVIGSYISILASLGEDIRKLDPAKRSYNGGSGGSGRDFVKEREGKALLTAEKKRTAAEIAAAKAKETAAKKQLLLEKARAALTKAAANFDLNKIQIAAALKATYDKDERLRLLAMQAIEDENGEAALSYIKMANALTTEQQTNKLAGIKTISETELNYINQLLLDELQRIKTTKMSEEEAALARQAAYAKYNAAIQQSGGLAEANFYTEKTQVELLSIAKLASLDKVAAAQATMDILNYNTQIDIIAKIAAAQKVADDAKYKAQQDYLALLAAPLPPLDAGGSGVKPPKFGVGGQPLYDQNGNYQYGDYMPPTGSSGSMGSVDNSITVVVEGNVLNSDDFDEAVSAAMRNAQRTGYSQYAAGSLP